MKKILPFILIIIAALVLAACGSRNSSTQTENRDLSYAVGGAPAAPEMAEAPMPAADQFADSKQWLGSQRGTHCHSKCRSCHCGLRC